MFYNLAYAPRRDACWICWNDSRARPENEKGKNNPFGWSNRKRREEAINSGVLFWEGIAGGTVMVAREDAASGHNR